MFMAVVAYLGDKVGKLGTGDFDALGCFNVFTIEMRIMAVVMQVIIEFRNLVIEIPATVCDLVNR